MYSSPYSKSLSVWVSKGGSNFGHCKGFCCSPQWEGPLLVTAQSAAVDGGGARHGVQVVRAVGQCGNPLTVPLCFLFPGDNPRHMDVKIIQKCFLFHLKEGIQYSFNLTNIVFSIIVYIPFWFRRRGNYHKRMSDFQISRVRFFCKLHSTKLFNVMPTFPFIGSHLLSNTNLSLTFETF